MSRLDVIKGLSLDALRDANCKRIPWFRDKKGRRCHAKDDGSDLMLSQWCNAVTGELGELANLIKKIERGDFTLEEVQRELGKECADVLTYLDILAFRAGINLSEATRDKFNEVSERVGAPIRLSFNDWHYADNWIPACRNCGTQQGGANWPCSDLCQDCEGLHS